MGVGGSEVTGTFEVGGIAMVSWNCMDLSDLGLGLKQGERDTRNSNYVMGVVY